MKIIGIGGLPRSGKDSLAELLIKDGYFGISFGDVVRDYARQRHADRPDPISVANMTETSNWLRETYGPDVILQEALKQYKAAQTNIDSYKGLVLWSIRAPVEVDFILTHGGQLVWVETSDQVRYNRNNQHRREGEPELSFEDFKVQEALQWQPQPGLPKEVQMDISYVKDHATKVLSNNSDDFNEFLASAKQLMLELGAL